MPWFGRCAPVLVVVLAWVTAAGRCSYDRIAVGRLARVAAVSRVIAVAVVLSASLPGVHLATVRMILIARDW